MLPVRVSKLSGYVADLEHLARDHRLRGLKARAGIDFTSNDYLALANAPRIKRAVAAALERGPPLGAGGSRLLRGNCEEHEALEADAARFFRAEASLFFGSGYIANYSVLTTLPQRGDLVVLDSLVHGSIHEGGRAGRASCQLAGHNEPQLVEDTIRRWRTQGGSGRVWIVVESLYSMDGDFAPLKDLVEIADRHATRSCWSMRPMQLAYMAPMGEGARHRMKDARISLSSTPAVKHWALPARWSRLPVYCATLWSTAVVPLFSRPRPHH